MSVPSFDDLLRRRSHDTTRCAIGTTPREYERAGRGSGARRSDGAPQGASWTTFPPPTEFPTQTTTTPLVPVTAPMSGPLAKQSAHSTAPVAGLRAWRLAPQDCPVIVGA